METRALVIIFSAAIALAAFHFRPTSSQEVEDEREFSYQQGSPDGPEHWGEIHRNWTACNGGGIQSPIDLEDDRVVVLSKLGKLHRDLEPSAAVMVNRGHDIMLRWTEGAGGMWINGTEYTLKQLHWHSPSEHSINGKRMDLELHMVHESADNRVAVVGILYKIGRPDAFLSEMEKYIHAIKNIEHGEEEVGVVNPRHIKRGSRKYYRYVGSLTTPPCTEGVVWTIVKKVRTVSHGQVLLLRDAVNDESEMNARPIQPINSRKVELFRPQT